MTFLFAELNETDVSTMPACTSISRSWCDPSQYDEVVGLDFGSKAAHYYMARSGKSGHMSFAHLRDWLLRLPSKTLVICESAHLGEPQTDFSLAQPFKADELLQLDRDLVCRGVTLKLAPHAHTGRRMRMYVAHHFPEIVVGCEKSDAADAQALAIYADRCNEISLANPHKNFAISARRQFGRKVTKLSNALLNAERTDGYKGSFYPIVLKLSRSVRGRASFFRGVPDDSRLKLVVTVASTLVSERDGGLVVLTHRGQPPGRWFWMRDVLRMSPWHHRGGTARSNLMWHTFRPFFHNMARRNYVSVKSGNTYKDFAHHDERQKAARTFAMRSFRQLLLQCRDMCLEQAKRMNAGHLELTDIPEEVRCGR